VARYVIVGNGAAGTAAAEELRKKEPSSTVILLTDEPYPLYNRVSLRHYLKGEIPERKVFVRDLPWHEKYGIDFRPNTPVVALDVGAHTVTTAGGTVIPYDRLLIATGGTPTPLAVPGGDAAGVMYLQTLRDARLLEEALAGARRAVVVGGSYLAYNFADIFQHRGLETTWLIRGPSFLRRDLDETAGALVDRLAREAGVTVIHGEEIASVRTHDGHVAGAVTTAGRELAADIIGAGIGLTMNLGFVRGQVEMHRGVIVDAGLRSSAPDVYAAGDVAEFPEPVTGARMLAGTWDNAAAQGRLAAGNMMGGHATYQNIPEHNTDLFASQITVMGITPDVRADLESVARLDETGQNYRRLFFWQGRLVGAVLIGSRKGKLKLLQMIRDRVPVSGPRETLLDPEALA